MPNVENIHLKIPLPIGGKTLVIEGPEARRKALEVVRPKWYTFNPERDVERIRRNYKQYEAEQSRFFLEDASILARESKSILGISVYLSNSELDKAA